MKKLVQSILIIFFITLLFFFPYMIQLWSNSANQESANGFTISSFDTEIEVYKNNRISVNEHITVNWTETGHQGIYRVIPTWQNYTSSNGKTYNRMLDISSLYSPEQYLTAKKIGNKKLGLQLGKSNETVPLGLHTYQVRYNGNFGDDPYSGFDEFIFHAYGDDWETQISNPSLKITLPSQIDNPSIKFYAGEEGNEDITQFVDCSVDGNVITASVKDNYKLNKSLTVAILLPDGYFSGTQSVYTNRAIYICAFSIIVAVALFITWARLKKGNPKIAKISLYYPPNGLDPSQVGYIFKRGESSKKLSVALIMSLSNKGYIKIYENGGNHFSVYNLCIEDGKHYRNEKNLAIPEGLAYTSINKLEPLTKNEKLVYDKLFERADVNSLNEDDDFYKVFNQVEKELQSTIGKSISNAKANMFKAFAWVFTILSIALMMVGFYVIEDIEPKYQFLYTLGIIASLSSIVPSIYIARISPYGEEIKSKVDSFRDFIEKVDTEKINNLISQNPTYFYDILPYAYVFGLYKSWIDKSNKVIIPEQVVSEKSSINYFDCYIFDHISDNLHYPVGTGESN